METIFERLTRLYTQNKISDLSVYVQKNLITQNQADEIMGVNNE